ncbi:MAG: hypothetical protein NT035_06755, partial [Burkholderiales bacterium]|nr:hypothetical protein [Burkholderiales bacterium]
MLRSLAVTSECSDGLAIGSFESIQLQGKYQFAIVIERLIICNYRLQQTGVRMITPTIALFTGDPAGIGPELV